jgi:hypothetical protein
MCPAVTSARAKSTEAKFIHHISPSLKCSWKASACSRQSIFVTSTAAA